jgi:hypothetical protein
MNSSLMSGKDLFHNELKYLVNWFEETIQPIQYDAEKRQYKLSDMNTLCLGLYPSSRDGSVDSPIRKPFITEIVTRLEKIVQTLQIYRLEEELKKEGTTSPMLISIQNMRVIYTFLELLWHWGMKKHILTLSENLNLPDDLSQPKSLLVNKDLMEFLTLTDKSKGKISIPLDIEIFNDLLRCTKVLNDIVTDEMFAHQMLERNINRILLSLIVLKRDRPNEETVVNLLNSLKESNFRHIIISRMRVFVSATSWLRNDVSQILADVIQSEKGVESVIRAYLEGSYY